MRIVQIIMITLARNCAALSVTEIVWLSLPTFVSSFLAIPRQFLATRHQPTITIVTQPLSKRRQHQRHHPKRPKGSCVAFFTNTNTNTNTIVTLEEPDETESTFGRLAYWDESYQQQKENDHRDLDDDDDDDVFSWYCGWTDELGPFFEELVPDRESIVLVPGIGNDAAIRDMFDVGGYQKILAFDYAPRGIEAAKIMFGTDRLEIIANRLVVEESTAAATTTTTTTTTIITNKDNVFRVGDARDLSGEYGDDTFDAVLDKGTLDAIYLSGGKNKDRARTYLDLAVAELKRVLKKDGNGIVFSVTAACVEAVRSAFDDDKVWEQIRDGDFYTTHDGYTSHNVDATMLAWKLKLKQHE